jgi:hypothetical protein
MRSLRNKKSMGYNFFFKVYLIAFLVLNFSIIGSAQEQLKMRQASYYKYVYKLSEKDIFELYNLPESEEIGMKYFYNLVDSIESDSKEEKHMPPGYYLYVYSEEGTLYIKPERSSNLKIWLLNNNENFSMLLFDMEGNKIEEATVSINDKNIPFNKKTGTYFLTEIRQAGILKIRYKDDLLIKKISTKEEKTSWSDIKDQIFVDPVDHLTESLERKTRGYILSDKLVYAPGDTACIKALVISNNHFSGKKMKLYLAPDDLKDKFQHKRSIHSKYISTVKPDEKGNYLFNWKLPDTLRKGGFYNFYLLNNKNELYTTFLADDYKYSASSRHKFYFPGDTIQLFIKASDLNDRALPGLKAELDIQIKIVKLHDSLTQYVPFSFYKKTFYFDTCTEYKISIPVKDLPDMKVYFTSTIKYTNAQGVQREAVVNFDAENKKDYFFLSRNGEELKVDYYKDGKLSSIEGELHWEYYMRRKVRFPYTFKDVGNFPPDRVKVGTDYYSIQTNLIAPSPKILYSNKNGKVSIKLDNPTGKEIWYTLYREKELIESGRITHYQKDTVDNPHVNYYMRIEYIQKGYYKNEEYSICEEYSKPALSDSITNILYYSNGFYYKNKFRKYKKIDNKEFNFQLRYFNADSTAAVLLNKKLGIDSLMYYKFKFPPPEGYFLYTKTSQKNAQVAPHIYSESTKYTIHYIMVDDTLIYYPEDYHYHNTTPYAFFVSPGYHNFKIRLWSSIILINRIYCKEGYKLDFSFDLSNLESHRVTVYPAPVYTTDEETKMLYKKRIKIEDSRLFPRVYINIGNYIEMSYYYNKYIGPVKGDSVVFYTKDYIHKLPLYTNYIYKINSTEVELISPDPDYGDRPKSKSLSFYVDRQYIGQWYKDQDSFMVNLKRYSPNFVDIDTNEMYYTSAGKNTSTVFFLNPGKDPLMYCGLYNSKDVLLFSKRGPIQYNLPPGDYKLVEYYKNDKRIITNKVHLGIDSLLIFVLGVGDSIIQSDTSLEYRLFKERYYLTSRTKDPDALVKSIYEINLKYYTPKYLYTDSRYIPETLNYTNIGSFKGLKIKRSKISVERNGFFNHRYKYPYISAGLTGNLWNAFENYHPELIRPGLNLTLGRRISPRYDYSLSVQYSNQFSSTHGISRRNNYIGIGGFLSADLFQHRGKYQKRPKMNFYIKSGLNLFYTSTQEHSTSQWQKVNGLHPLQPYLPAGLGYKYKLSKQTDLDFNALYYFNLYSKDFGKSGSTGNMIVFQASLKYIIPTIYGTPKFR